MRTLSKMTLLALDGSFLPGNKIILRSRYDLMYQAVGVFQELSIFVLYTAVQLGVLRHDRASRGRGATVET